MTRTFLIGAVAIVAIGGFYWLTVPTEQSTPATINVDGASTALAEVVLPETLSENARIGQRAYETNCASCHGAKADGQADVAPPLIHKIYESGHHADEAFQRAATLGVQAHHWPFGNMPPVKGITRGDVTFILAFIREVQQANGID